MLVRANIVEDEKRVQSNLVERETKREKEAVVSPDARSSRLRRAVPRGAALLLAQFAAAAINTSGDRTLLRGEARACSPLPARL